MGAARRGVNHLARRQQIALELRHDVDAGERADGAHTATALRAAIRGGHLDANAADGARDGGRGDVAGGAAVVGVALDGVGGALDHGGEGHVGHVAVIVAVSTRGLLARSEQSLLLRGVHLAE